ncbi:lipopolysaccharide assembly protein LapA domain-containing protein [Enterococcus sp. DIV1059_2]|uniref:LapA family protein n=1 Tax=Enterococcus sp. DIV1059_2 TaxID=2774664 RepID=UPI003F1F6AD9
MKNQWRVIVGILLILVIVLFAVANNMTVPINFGFATIQSPLILAIIGSALLGALILLLVSTSAMFRQKKELKQLRKELSDYRSNNEKVLQEQREALEREYTNKQAELAARQQQLDDQEAQLSSRAAGASTPPTIDEEMKSFESQA